MFIVVNWPASKLHWTTKATDEIEMQALHSFISQRLPLFGRYEDALWPGEPWLYHSLCPPHSN